MRKKFFFHDLFRELDDVNKIKKKFSKKRNHGYTSYEI